MIGGLGVSAYRGASRDPLFADWTSEDYDPEDVVRADAYTIGARSADALRNNAYYAAILNAMRDGVVGPEGLRFRSQYQVAPRRSGQSELSYDAQLAQEHDHRSAIDQALSRALGGTAIDAAGLHTWAGLQAIALASKAVYGEFFAQRVLLPHRPGARSHATCWRILHPARCQTPPRPPATILDGIELDAAGSPIAAWFTARHPNALAAGDPGHRRIPFFDRRGVRQLIWYAARQFPEQLRGVGWIGPVMSLIQMLGGTAQAHVIAKRLQACMGCIIEVQDPARAAAADKNGEVLTPRTLFFPGKNYYVKKGTVVTPFNFSYNGSDFEMFSNTLLQAVCAGFGPGLPYQFVLKQLTKSNMASSRAALMQAWRAFRGEQEELIQHLACPIKDSILDEDLARGRLLLPTGQDLVAAGHGLWRRPPRLSPDDYRDAQAAERWHAVGASKSTLLAERDLDYDDEALARRRDAETDEDLALGPPIPAPAAEADPLYPDEPDDDEPDDEEAPA